MKDAFAAFALLAACAVAYSFSGELEGNGTAALLVLWISGLLFDLFLLTKAGQGSTRVTPVFTLSLLFFGVPGLLAASALVLLGSCCLIYQGTDRRHIWGDLVRALAPVSAIAAFTLPLPKPLPTIALLLAFLLLSLALEPRRFTLKPSFLTLFCAPWLALTINTQLDVSPWSTPLLLPVLLALSRGKDESFPLLVSLGKVLKTTQERAQAQSKKVRKLAILLKAANQMARSLDPEALQQTLLRGAESCGAKEAKIVLQPTSTTPDGLPLLGGEGRLLFRNVLDAEQRELIDILTKIFSTAWQNAQLHAKVVEALEETKRSQAMVVESSRMAAMGLMAAGIAHEVNTPLGAIQLNAELAEMLLTKNPEKCAQKLQSILSATERAQKAVERTLYYAKPMGANDAETFSVDEVIDDALELLSHRIVRSKVTVERDIDSTLQLTGERQAFFSLLFNLVLNGADAVSDVDQPKVWVRAGAREQTMVLEVEDSGPGVPPDHRTKIFDPFFTSKPSGEGTGLGLHLAQQAAEQFGGTVQLTPSRGNGAIFRVELPLGRISETLSQT